MCQHGMHFMMNMDFSLNIFYTFAKVFKYLRVGGGLFFYLERVVESVGIFNIVASISSKYFIWRKFFQYI